MTPQALEDDARVRAREEQLLRTQRDSAAEEVVRAGVNIREMRGQLDVMHGRLRASEVGVNS